MDILSDDGIQAASNDDLIKYNEGLMAEKEAITEEQLKVKAELNKRHALKGFKALPKAEQDALVQHIRAGSLDTGASK